jgi:O-antigen/teichoic acid export membrane protein
MFITANVLNYDPQVVAYTYIAGLSLIPGALSIVGESVVQGLEQMHYVTIARAIGGAIKLILSIPLLYFSVGLWSIFVVIALSNFVLYLIYLWIINRSLGPNDFHFDRVLIRHLLHLAGPFVVISIFGVVFKQVDVLMLGKMKDLATVGLYSSAYRIVRLGMQLLPVFMLALFPHMSEVHARFPERLGGIAAQVARLLMVLVIPLAVIATVLAEEIISLIYGPGYQAAAPVLRALVWMLVLFSANSVLFRTMLASDNERVTMRIAGVNMVSSVLLNLLLIPRWGASGVAVASLCTTLIALLQNYVYVARHLFTINWVRLIGKPGLAAALLGGFLFAMRGSPILVSLPLGITLYGATVFVLRVFSPEELDFLRRVLTDAKARISL